MLKKILYVAASFMIGFMLISSLVVTNFYTVFQKFAAEDVNNKEYTSAERFFSRVIDENKFYSQEVNGVWVEVYSALNDGVEYVYDDKNEKTSTSYYTLESSIQFSFFNLPDSFALVDNVSNAEDKKTGGVKLVFGDDKSAFFPFKTESIDYYGFETSYSYLPLSISYAQYTSALTSANISLDSLATSAVIIDGDGEEEMVLTFETGKNPSFNTKFHQDYYDITIRYNKIQEINAKGEETSEEEATAIKSQYDALLANNSSYLEQHDFNLIYGSFDFLFAIITAVVIFLALDILLGWFLFRKKKVPTYVPPGQKKQPTQTRQPEQFTRDVFNLEEDDVVVSEETKEEAVEETPEETPTEE